MAQTLAPLITQPVKAGFPNPAEESGSVPLDLNKLVIKHPASTFYMRVDGDSMVDRGIYTGDLVVIDKSLEIRSGDLVVAYVNGEFTLKTFKQADNRGYLLPANPKYQPIVLDENTDFQIWGVVVYTLHSHRGKL